MSASLPRPHPALFSTLLLAATLAPALAAAPDPRIPKVKRGLLPPFPVAGEPAWDLQERMRTYQVPGVSIAVMDQGRIVWAKGYGFADLEAKRPVTAATPFQAGRAGLLPAAMGAMRLVDQGVLGLDQDLDRYLKTWKQPAPADPAWAPVTLRQVLGLSSGLTGGRTPGLPPAAALPSAAQVLRGEAPATSDPVQRRRAPGLGLLNASPNTLVLQQAMGDAAGEAFPTLMARLLFRPLGMAASSFAQPLPDDPALATGYRQDGSPLPGRAQHNPDAIAEGLWSTPSDLLKAALELRKAAQGRSRILSAGSATAMLTPRLAQPFSGSGRLFGLGVGLLRADGNELYAVNGGNSAGFTCRFVFNPRTGQGAAVMMNAEPFGCDLAGEVIRGIAKEYHWPGYLRTAHAVTLEPGRAEAVAGRFLIHGDAAIELRARGGKLFLMEAGAEVPLFPLAQNLFKRTDQDVQYLAEDHRTLQRIEEGRRERAGRTTDAGPTPSEWLSQGRLPEAVAAFRALHKLEPTDPGVAADHLADLAGHLSSLGRPDAALAIHELDAEFHPGLAWSWIRLAGSREENGQPGPAREAYGKALEMTGRDASLNREDLGYLRDLASGKLEELTLKPAAPAPVPADRP